MTLAQNSNEKTLLIKSASFIITTILYSHSPSLFFLSIYDAVYFIVILLFLQIFLGFAKMNSLFYSV